MEKTPPPTGTDSLLLAFPSSLYGFSLSMIGNHWDVKA